jgi:uncharacterized membrane protein HdeD (DUF308 family)
MSTSTYLTDTVKEMAPWRKGVRWWVVLLQGLVLAAMGGFGLWRPGQAGIGISLALAALLVVQAVWVIVAAMRGREYGMSVFNLLAAGGGLVAGVGVLVPYLFQADYDLQTAWANFGLALAIVGLLTLASAFVERPNQGIAWATLLRGLFNLGFGAYIFWVALSENAENPVLIRWLSIALLVVGGLLIVWSILLFLRRPKDEPAAAAA